MFFSKCVNSGINLGVHYYGFAGQANVCTMIKIIFIKILILFVKTDKNCCQSWLKTILPC